MQIPPRHRHIEGCLHLRLHAVFLMVAVCTFTGCRDETGPSPIVPIVTAIASAKGRVDIEGGVIRLAAQRDGVIAKVMVEEGARVKAGQVLATLNSELAQRNLTLAQWEVKQAEQHHKRVRIELAAADREFNRLESLRKDDAAPRQEIDRARDARILAEVAVEASLAAIETARARQAVAAREIEERKVTAPLDGQIIQRQARPGNGVSTLNVTPLFLFLPDVPRIIRAEVEEQYVNAVSMDQPVEILLEVDPDTRWHGRVLRIGRLVGGRTPSHDPAEKQDNRVVEVVVTMDTTEASLIGQRVIVRFLAS